VPPNHVDFGCAQSYSLKPHKWTHTPIYTIFSLANSIAY